MRLLVSMILAAALLCLAPTASWADLAPYGQDFELLGTGAEDPAALADDGWLVWVNVYGPDWWKWYDYWAPTPNGGSGFCGVDTGQGGPPQGDKQLVVYNDYNNGNHGDNSNAIIEANVYQERTIGAADVGSTWRFEFDAKRGNIGGNSMAAAFIKTFTSGWALIHNIQAPMTDIPETWDRYQIDVYIDPSLEGGVLQFGFINWASNYEGSGIFYDNLDFDLAPLSVDLDIRPGGCPNPITGTVRGLVPVALLGTGAFDVNDIDVASLQLEGVAPVLSAYEDVAAPYAGDLCGCTDAGPDGFLDLSLKFSARDLIAAIGSLQNGDRTLTLTGTLLDGTPIEGQDCIITVGRTGRAALLEALSSANPLMPSSSTRKANVQPLSRPSRSE